MGRIELIIGCMFASKSTELIKLANRYMSIGKNILIIKHSFDNRYSENKISTHDKIMIDCISTDKLNIFSKNQNQKLHELYMKSEIIIIEELQFFNDSFDFVTKGADIYNKIFICAGLDGDFNRKPFMNVVNLIPHSDKITKLTAFCKICSDGTPGIFSKIKTKYIDLHQDDKKESNENNIIIGSDDKYIAVCRKHYNTNI